MLKTIKEAVEQFHPDGPAYIIAGPTEDGQGGLCYQGNEEQLSALLNYIVKTLREDEGIISSFASTSN